MIDKAGYRTGEKTDDKDDKNAENDIIMPQPTRDRNPIATRLKDFIPFLHQSKHGSLIFNHHEK